MITAANASDHAADEEELVVNDRTCIVSRKTFEPQMLIRFVAGPQGQVVPDLKRQLPGRGCWVKAERAQVDLAIKRKIFARALKQDVKADADLGALVERLLVADLTGMMSMARKAGQFISGAMKVDNAVRTGEAVGVFHAADAAADGVRKIDQARKAWRFGTDAEEEIPSFRLFTAAEMDELMGHNAFIHAAALAGQAGEGVVKRATMLETYRDGGQSGANGGAGRSDT